MRIATVVTCVALVPALAQTPTPPDAAQIRAAAFDVMTAARYSTFVTVGADGQPQARIVDPLVSRGETSIWIATNPLTRKVEEIRRDPRVTLTFFNQAGGEYVTVIGTAHIVTDAAEKAKRWKPEWAPFYKDQTRGPDFLLFEVRPSRLEISAPGRGMISDPKAWRPVILDLRQGAVKAPLDSRP
jgi:general stress protein 26